MREIFFLSYNSSLNLSKCKCFSFVFMILFFLVFGILWNQKKKLIYFVNYVVEHNLRNQILHTWYHRTCLLCQPTHTHTHPHTTYTYTYACKWHCIRAIWVKFLQWEIMECQKIYIWMVLVMHDSILDCSYRYRCQSSKRKKRMKNQMKRFFFLGEEV